MIIIKEMMIREEVVRSNAVVVDRNMPTNTLKTSTSRLQIRNRLGLVKE